MTAIKGLGTYGNAAGVVTPLDHKIAQAGSLVKTTTALKVRAGVFYNGVSNLVTGTAGMAYSVAAYHIATQRSPGAGVVFGGNDGALSVATTAAPGSNSRIDIIYHWHREFSLDGVDSNPVIGVVQGTAAAVPVAPSLAAFPGAVEIARATVAAGATATNGAGVTITNTCPFTTSDGGVLTVRTAAELTPITDVLEGQKAVSLDNDTTYRWDGAAWIAWDSPWLTSNPTVTGVATSAKDEKYQYVGGNVIVDGEVTVSAAPTGSVTLSTPVTMAAPGNNQSVPMGTAEFLDVGTTALVGTIDSTAANLVRVLVPNASGTYLVMNNLAASVPFGWASGDKIKYRYTIVLNR